MNGTLQDRLVKELRLRGFSSMADANAYAPAFITDFNARFAKVPRSDFNAHRPIHNHEDLRRIFCRREWRKVSHSLSLQYDKTLYLLEDLPHHRQLIHRYIEVAEYPDGVIELWAERHLPPYTTHYRYPGVDQGAIVENKRLGHVLQIAQKVQALRDNRHHEGPSRTMSGVPQALHLSRRMGVVSDRSTASIWNARCAKVRWPRCRTMTYLRSLRIRVRGGFRPKADANARRQQALASFTQP